MVDVPRRKAVAEHTLSPAGAHRAARHWSITLRDPLPLNVPLPHAPLVFGLSRSSIYRAAADGKITLRKLGRTTLVDTASMLAFIDGMPTLAPKKVA
jgi:hypothetical protein